MNEDDTFRILRQKPYGSFEKIVLPILRDNKIKTEEQADRLLRQYGWTFNEFNNEFIRRNGN